MPEEPSTPQSPDTEARATTEPPSSTASSEPPTTEPEAPAEVMPGASEDDLRAEVRRLRDEAAASRVGSRRADTLAARLVESYAAATGLLADPTDLRVEVAEVLDDEGNPDAERVREAVEALVEAKPHLASRTPRGDVDQGARDDAPGVDLAGLLRAGA